MDITRILKEVEAEIAKLQRVADALRGSEGTPRIKQRRRRAMSKAVRARLSAAKKAWWKAQKRGK